jgi:DNA-binding IclR family transcriptional regulator
MVKTAQQEVDEPASAGLDRALRVILEVATSPEDDMGISELARSTKLSKAVVHRIARTLVGRGFFAYDEKTQRYRLGSAALTVGLAAMERLNVPRIAQPHLIALVEKTSETATLSALLTDHRVYVRQVLSPQEIRMSVQLGLPFPLYAGGSSLAILASFTDEHVDRVLAEAHGAVLADGSVLDPVHVREEVALIRDRGYAISRGERQAGATSLACAVRQSDGTVFGSMSLCGPSDRFDQSRIDEFSGQVRAAAETISRELGYTAPLYSVLS